MAIITAGLYRLDLFQEYFLTQVINTFWFKHTLDSNDEADLCAQAFDEDIMPSLAPAQNNSTSYLNIKVTPIFGTGVEENLTPTITVGTLVGTPMSTYMAASIKLNRSTNELRNGWKRICGIVEESTGATSFSGGYNTILDTLATALGSQISTVGGIFDPMIVRKPFSTKAMSPNWEAILVGSAVALNRPTSQVTRKLF